MCMEFQQFRLYICPAVVHIQLTYFVLLAFCLLEIHFKLHE